MPLFDVPVKSAMGNDTKYSRAIKIPQYNPSNEMPDISSLVDTQKSGQLIRAIENSNVSEEEKKFLKLAAQRHVVFNYAKIADYYAHATPEMQDLMEQSALVIVDIDDAIANGYIKLSAKMEQLIAEEKKRRQTNE